MKLTKHSLQCPELDSLEFINCEPIKISRLLGRVILLDFWDYSSVYCLRGIPYIKAWHGRYVNHGLSVIGIHSPIFNFGRDAENVRNAVDELGILYPVALDNDFIMWQKFSSRFRPTKYLVDDEGYIIYYFPGEGNYSATERAIQELIRQMKPKAVLPRVLDSLRSEDADRSRIVPVTPAIFLGYKKGRLGNPEGYHPDKILRYRKPIKFLHDIAHLSGSWFAGDEYIANRGEEEATLTVNYEASEVHVVMGMEGREQGEVSVYQDGAPIGRTFFGEAVTGAKDKAVIKVRNIKNYNVVKNNTIDRFVLELRTRSSGLRIYSISFISSEVVR
jgi:thiol-disulfide isomerase/thioredoxin